MSETKQILTRILQEASAAKSGQLQTLAVFDLDSTLFDVSPRLKRILHDFAADSSFQKRFPESTAILSQAETLRSDWGIKQAIIRSGLADHSSEFHHEVKNYWMSHFFSNEYLHYDIPYQGAVDFVLKMQELGVQICYLTGRDRPGMEKGTREVLSKWGFPVDMDNLFMKPAKGDDDADFKVRWFKVLPENRYARIWFFENEPLNIHLLRGHLHNLEIVYFDSTHSGKAPPPLDLPKIIHYMFEAE